MTRAEFEEICTYDELISLCCELDYDSDLYYKVHDRDSYDDYIEEEISDYRRNCTWEELRDWLNDLPESHYGYYYSDDGYGGWGELSDGDGMFSDLMDEVRDYMENYGLFDDEYIEEDDEDEYEEDPEPDESILSLFDDCRNQCVACGT